MKITCNTIAAALLATLACQAQDEKQGPPPGRPPHPPLPVFEALNTDDDEKLSAEEIKAASESLLTLDTDGDGKLSKEELRPKPPQGEEASKEEQEGNSDKKARRPRGPVPPLMAVLDKDRDGELSKEEIEAAPEALAKLNKNNDGELTPKEIHPHPPRPPKADDDEEEETEQQGPPQGEGRRPGQGGGRPPRGR
ncbi:MAG TPA: hypothetical protein VGE67_07350 [Haloferula sp.]